MAATETLRPDEDVSSAWSGTTVANIDDAVTDPTAGDGAVCRALVADTGLAQVFGFPVATGVDDDDSTQGYDHAAKLVVKFYSHAVVDTSIDVTVRVRANPTAAWSELKNFTVSQTYAWNTGSFVLAAAEPVGGVEPQVEVTPYNIAGVGASFDLDALYVEVVGLSLITADSAQTKPEDSCFEILAEDAGVQAWLRAEGSQQAAQRIYFEWNAPGVDLFYESCPFIVLSQGQPAQWSKVSVGHQNYLRPNGAVTVLLVDRDRFPDNIADSRIAFKNFLADVQLALVNRAGTATDLMITTLSPTRDAERNAPEQDDAMRGGLWEAEFQVQWGDV